MAGTDPLADHLAAELAETFARRHNDAGNLVLAAFNWREAADLYQQCGCVEYARGAAADACAAEHAARPARTVPARWGR